jgi:predicted alpha/beta-fold hydrolase
MQTVVPTLFRKVEGVRYQRERMTTPDDDFLDLDWSRVGSRRVAILSHGLEGNTERAYIRGMVKALNRRGWDALAWNFRGCSGTPNRRLQSYHSGATGDLQLVIDRALQDKYTDIALIGFSLGGNMNLKYMGENGSRIHPAIKKAISFSVPCDLKSGAEKMALPSNKIYMIRFFRMLREKMKLKSEMFPGAINVDGIDRISDFKEFDGRYTAPIHGFRDAEDYWQKASCKQFLTRIAVPSLLVNAKNDPFLDAPCYPMEEAEANPNFFLEIPESGGHASFVTRSGDGEYWSESRALEFLNS